jgi:hypothetical protein
LPVVVHTGSLLHVHDAEPPSTVQLWCIPQAASQVAPSAPESGCPSAAPITSLASVGLTALSDRTSPEAASLLSAAALASDASLRSAFTEVSLTGIELSAPVASGGPSLAASVSSFDR